MKRTVLITGARGFVGAHVLDALSRTHACVAVDALPLGGHPHHQIPVMWHRMDITDSKAFRALIMATRPDAIVHAAALADVDVCEENADLAHRVNVETVHTLVETCSHLEKHPHVVFFSTDTVFDGTRGGYAEADAPCAVNTYARTKIEAERILQSYAGPWTLMRLSLVVGLPIEGSGNSFLLRMARSLSEEKPVSFPSEEIRSPVPVQTVAACVSQAVDRTITGVFHLGGDIVVNRYEMARRLASTLGYSQAMVHDSSAACTESHATPAASTSLAEPAGTASPTSAALSGQSPSAKAGKRARRPHNVSLNNSKAKRTFNQPSPDFSTWVQQQQTAHRASGPVRQGQENNT